MVRTLIGAVTVLALAACDDNRTLQTDLGAGDGPLQTDGPALADAPVADTSPVATTTRVLLLVDSSGSMDYSDPADAAGQTQVQRAAKELLAAISANPSLSLTVIRYNATILVNGGASEEITRDATVVQKAIASLAQHETMSDVEGALTTAAKIIERDLQQLGAAERARTRYNLVLLADGHGLPACADGCDNDPHPVLPGVWSWCDLPRSQWCSTYAPTGTCNMESWFQGLVQCKAYNNDATLVSETGLLVGLAAQYGAQSIRAHTLFLASMGSQPADIRTLMGYDEAAAEAQLKQVAAAGGGVYRKYARAADLSFETIKLAP